MKVTGIIAEYNPFHNGHKHQIEQARLQTGADYIIVVMSGDFTQRGTPAIISKYSRAQMALASGADLVLELPLCYATGGAEYFAQGAIALLDALGCVDTVCFGSECGNIEELTRVSTALVNETSDYKAVLKNSLRNGNTFPIARKAALQGTLNGFASYENILNYPNNILGIEYIKAIIKQQSSITPFTIQRLGADYHSYKFSNNQFSSALAVRQAIEANSDLSNVKGQLPAASYEIMKEEFGRTFPIFPVDFSAMLKYKLLCEQSKGYTDYLDVTREISDKINNYLFQLYDYDMFCELLKSKEVTFTRISRCLFHILLDITKEDVNLYMDNGYVFYAKVLGMGENISSLQRALKKNSSIPFITKMKEAESLIYPIGQRQFKRDLAATNLYSAVVSMKYKHPAKEEFARKILKV